MKQKNTASPRRERGERIRINIEKKEEHNEYYRRVGAGYKVMKFLSVAALLVYLIVMMCIYRSEITYDNLMYLIKDLDTDVSASVSDFADISYEEGAYADRAIFRNRLAVATGTKFTLYNTAGAAELELNCTMEDPVILTSDKYVMVYDLGGTSYSVYTTIAKVLEKTSEYEIQGAALSDSGSFAVITRSRENRYLVDFFNENFKERSRLYKDKYVMDVALDSKGKNYAVVSTDIQDSDFICEVMIGEVDSENSYTSEITGALPLSVEALDNGTFAVICDSGIYFFSSSGERVGEYEISGLTLQLAEVNGDSIMLSGAENLVGSSSKVVLLDSTGSELYQSSFAGKISRTALGDDYMFILIDSELSRISLDGSVSSCTVDAHTEELIPVSDNTVVCTPSGAYMGFKSAEEQPGASTDTAET